MPIYRWDLSVAGYIIRPLSSVRAHCAISITEKIPADTHTPSYISPNAANHRLVALGRTGTWAVWKMRLMDCCGFRKRGKYKAATQQTVTHASPVNSSSTGLAALKRTCCCLASWWLVDICDAVKKRITFGKWGVWLMLRLKLMLIPVI